MPGLMNIRIRYTGEELTAMINNHYMTNGVDVWPQTTFSLEEINEAEALIAELQRGKS